jgi:GNAT superfamily N-acetyltransferase
MTHIRLARPEDGSVLLDLTKEFATSFDVEDACFRQSLLSLLSDQSAYLAVAEERVVVGYLLGFDHVTFFANGRVSWVEEIMVRQEQRRSGVGRLLMQSFEAWAISRNSKLVALATRRAELFYRALGYEDSATYFRKVL